MKGRRTELVRVTTENMTRESDPIRPMSPRASLDL